MIFCIGYEHLFLYVIICSGGPSLHYLNNFFLDLFMDLICKFVACIKFFCLFTRIFFLGIRKGSSPAIEKVHPGTVLKKEDLV